ncbi:hypothetical protein HDU96_009618 [Phlyctochytrium bullatum]|nr:hypothetical protein HDU96_009618 [Phlyctochytrium bullatum]
MEQDARFADKHKKLLKSMKFPAIYNTKVDLKKVKLSAMKPWITKKVIEIVGMEDEVVVGYVFQLLEAEVCILPSSFVEQLWGLLVSAQEEHGIPKQFLEEKKLELIRKRAEEDRIAKELAKRRETEAETVGTLTIVNGQMDDALKPQERTGWPETERHCPALMLTSEPENLTGKLMIITDKVTGIEEIGVIDIATGKERRGIVTAVIGKETMEFGGEVGTR